MPRGEYQPLLQHIHSMIFKKEISNTYLKLDSISSELDQKILTIKELGGNIDTLTILKQQLEDDKRSLLSREKNQRNQITRLNDRVDGYKELLLMKLLKVQLKKLKRGFKIK